MFCIKCGTAVATAPSSGSPAPTSPNAQRGATADYIEVFKGVTAKDTFDLYVAPTRFVMMKTASGSSGGGGIGAVLGPVGSIMEMGVSKARRKKVADGDLTLDQRLRRDKNSFAIDYSQIISVKLGKGKLGGRIMQVRYAKPQKGDEKIDISMTSEQFDKIGKLLRSITALDSKLQLAAAGAPDKPSS